MTIGWENLFGEFLGKEYGEIWVQNYRNMFRNRFPDAQLICPACNRTYDLGACPTCEGPLTIKRELEVVRTFCEKCDRSYDKPRCKNDGSRLSFFLVGNEQKLLRPLSLIFFSDDEDWRTTGFYRKVCDISNVLPSLRYMENEKKLDRMTLNEVIPPIGSYLWRKNNAGRELEKELYGYLSEAGILKPLKDFVQMRIEDEFEKNAEIIEVNMSSISAFLPSEGPGEIKNKTGKITIKHIRG